MHTQSQNSSTSWCHIYRSQVDEWFFLIPVDWAMVIHSVVTQCVVCVIMSVLDCSLFLWCRGCIERIAAHSRTHFITRKSPTGTKTASWSSQWEWRVLKTASINQTLLTSYCKTTQWLLSRLLSQAHVWQSPSATLFMSQQEKERSCGLYTGSTRISCVWLAMSVVSSVQSRGHASSLSLNQ